MTGRRFSISIAPFAAWVFPRSALTAEAGEPWRSGSWRVDTRGVRLQRRGSYDVLVADRGKLPRQVAVTFTPVRERLQGDYAPALVFTDGSVALFVAQFDGFPMESPAAVGKLPSDLNNQMVPAAELKFRFRDAAGPVMLEGRRTPLAETDGLEYLRVVRRHAAGRDAATWSASSIRSCPRGSRTR